MTRGDLPHTDRVAALDLLRLIAAMWVLIWHFAISGIFIRHIGFRTPALEPLAQYGFLGVQVFFVISGFVISMSLQGRTAGQFMLARLIRLFPAYWICMAITLAVLWGWGNGQFSCDPACLALNTFMLNSFFDYPYLNPCYWSLAIELQFYLMAAILLLLRQAHHLLDFILLWLLIAATPLLRQHPALIDTAFYWSAGMWAPYFACGAALYFIRRDGVKLKPVLVLLLAWLLCFHYIQVDVDSVKPVEIPGRPFSVAAGFSLFSLFLGLILMICLRVISIRPSAWTRWAGGTSYPLYLLHEVIGFTLLNRFKGMAANGILISGLILLMVAASALTWRFAEAPLQGWLRKRLASGIGKHALSD